MTPEPHPDEDRHGPHPSTEGAADPVVSPADTPAVRIRRDASHLLRSVVTYGGVKEIIGDDLYRRSLLALRSLEVTPDELLTERAALLAVGERDKAEIRRLEVSRADLFRDHCELIRARERDRQRIARLTEALRISADAMIPLGKWLVDHQPSMPDEVAQPLLEWCGRAEEFMALSRKRLPCGCHAKWAETDWRIDAISFSCDSHKQGDAVLADEEDARP